MKITQHPYIHATTYFSEKKKKKKKLYQTKPPKHE